MRIRTKSLFRYFTQADEDLPPSYVKSCRAFLKKFNKGFKQQATSTKPQASSNKLDRA
jgi:hypothetical protein